MRPPEQAVYFFQSEKLLMTLGRDDPALDHLHTYFNFGLVAWSIRSCRHDSDAVVYGHLLKGGVGVRIAAARTAHSRPWVIREPAASARFRNTQRRHRGRNSHPAPLRTTKLAKSCRSPDHE